MTRFFVRLGVFCLILLVINCVLFFFLDSIYWKPYAKVDTNFESYLLADSHGLPIGSKLEQHGVYNLSAGSDSYSDMLRKLKYLIRNASVKTIYVIADDHMLSAYRERMNNGDRSRFFASRDDYETIYEYFAETYIKHYIIFSNAKSRDVLKSWIKGILKPKSGTVESQWSDYSPSKRQEKARERALLQFADTSVSQKLSEDLDDIIRLCKEHSIRLIGIKFPLADEYLKEIGPVVAHAELRMKRNGIEVFDYSREFLDFPEFFANQDHLNEQGGLHLVNALMEDALVQP